MRLKNGPPSDQKAERAIGELDKLMAEHPEDDKIPFWIAHAKLYQARQALIADRPADATRLFSESATVYDKSIEARPDVVPLYLGKASNLMQIRGLDTTPGNDYGVKLHDTLLKVQDMVDVNKSPDDYERAKQMWAETIAYKEPSFAQDIYVKLIERFPDQLRLRLNLARLLERVNRQQDALAVLDPIPTLAGPAVTDIGRRQAWEGDIVTSKLVRANIDVDLLINTPPGKARDALIADINSSLDVAEKRFAGTSQFLRVKGRFQLVNGQKRDAIDTLTTAAQKASVEGRKRRLRSAPQ